jgi:hypothetical protein
VNVKALEFHSRRGDFESWAEHSLRDESLAVALRKIKILKLKGEALREKMVAAVAARFSEASQQVQADTMLF